MRIGKRGKGLLACLLILVLLGIAYYIFAPQPILREDQAQTITGMRIYWSHEVDVTIPPPYSIGAGMSFIVSSGYLYDKDSEVMRYSAVDTMDEKLESGILDLMQKYKMERVLETERRFLSEEYTYHLECRRTDGKTVHVFVGSDTKPGQVTMDGKSWRILDEKSFRKEFEELTGSFLIDQLADRAWDKKDPDPTNKQPREWKREFTDGSEKITIRVRYSRTMEPGNLSVSFDGQNYTPVGKETIMFGVTGQTRSGMGLSGNTNFFCEYDGIDLYISGVDFSEDSARDSLYRVNPFNGKTIRLICRAPGEISRFEND